MGGIPEWYLNFTDPPPPKTATRGFLEENYWWWNWKILRKRQPPKDGPPQRGLGGNRMEAFDFLGTYAWNDANSRTAWSYELLMRHDRNVRLPAFYDLNEQERHFVRRLFDPGEPVYLEYGLSSFNEKTDPGWTPTKTRTQWNLRKSDNALTTAFLKYIYQYRERNGIKTPKKNVGRKQHKPPVWHLLEALDLHYYKLKTFGESERSQLTKTKRKATEFYRRFAAELRALNRADLSNYNTFESLLLPEQ